MTCPNCGAIFDESCRFCGACGAPLAAEKKGTHRVPILILIALSVLGIWVFFATGGSLFPRQAGYAMDEYYCVQNGALYGDPFALEGQTSITVPDVLGSQTVTIIDSYGFADFDDAVVIHLPDTVTLIREGAFTGCDSLRAMDLPPALTVIERDAFLDCDALEAVHIPASVESIGQDAFYECDSLAFIFYDGTIDEWKALYPQDLDAKTAVCCADGNFYQAD